MANELEIPGGVKVLNNVEVDALSGPYASLAAAKAAIPIAMRLYRTVKVISGGAVTEYVWKAGTADSDLILKADLGFTAENVANKATSLASPDNTKYPTTQAVKDANDAVISSIQNKFSIGGMGLT